MPAKWHKYSYTAQREERRNIMSVVLVIIALTAAFALVNTYLVAMYHIESSTMEPALSDGDSVVTTPLYRRSVADRPSLSPLIAPERGDLVVIAPAYPADIPLILRPLDAVVTFLTFQRYSPFERAAARAEKPAIRRVIAFPGDSLYMENYVLHIKPANTSHFLTEFEVSGQEYDLRIDRLPESWSDGLPFSASFPEITLKDDEFFVMCDNRLSASDSRVWGPIPADRIRGKVLFRYWPFRHFGAL